MASVFKRGGKKNRHGHYYVSWFDQHGKRQTRCARTTDKAAAQQLANELETQAMLRREGIIDAQAERLANESRRSIASLLEDFQAKWL